MSAEEKAQLEQVQKQVNQVKDPNLSKAILSTDLPSASRPRIRSICEVTNQHQVAQDSATPYLDLARRAGLSGNRGRF